MYFVAFFLPEGEDGVRCCFQKMEGCSLADSRLHTQVCMDKNTKRRKTARMASVQNIEIASIDSTVVAIHTRVCRLLFELHLLRRLTEIGIS